MDESKREPLEHSSNSSQETREAQKSEEQQPVAPENQEQHQEAPPGDSMTATEQSIVLALLVCILLGAFFVYRQIQYLEGEGEVGVDVSSASPPPVVSPEEKKTSSPLKQKRESLAQAVEESLKKGAAWLAKEFIPIGEGGDGAKSEGTMGGWHHFQWEERTPGAPTTALVLFALTSLPENLRQAYGDISQKAAQFLLSRMDERGAISELKADIQYRNYTTAMTLCALLQLDAQKYASQIQKMQQYFLRAQLQHIPQWNWHYGTWNYYEKNSLGMRVDISVTAFVLESLYRSKLSAEHPAFRKALIFLKRTQNYRPKSQEKIWDGGFAFHPRNSKAGEIQLPSGETVYLSYGSSTSDGLRSLIYCGLPLDHPRVKAAEGWLSVHFRVDRNPGFPDLDPAGIARGIRFYYYHSLSKALTLSQLKERRPMFLQRLARHVVYLQRKDGSWQNDTNTMSEDYPLIATSFALLALSELYPHLRRMEGASGSGKK